MDESARFPGIAAKAGHYESFYIKACRPGGGQGIWIRHTVHKRPGAEPNASIWFCLFDREAEGPRATKVTVPAAQLSAPVGLWIRVDKAEIGPGHASGSIATEALQRQLGPQLQRRRRALQVPAGRLALRGAGAADQVRRAVPQRQLQRAARDRRRGIELAGWPGMIGHNWGSEHAERWVWLEGTGFAEDSSIYFDAGAARVQVGAVDDALAALGDADARRRGAPARRLRPDPLRLDRGGAGRLRVHPAGQATSSSAAASPPRRRTSSAGSTPTPRAPSTTRSTARSPTSS